MLAGLGRSLLLAGGGVTGGLGIVAAVYGPGDLVQSVRSKLSLDPPAITAPEKPEWGERNLDLGRDLTPPDPAAPPTDKQTNAQAGLPSLDIVRVEPSGEAVIAGRGAPNASVEILRDNKPYASGVADETGQFAIVPPALPVGNSELTYRTTAPDGQPVMGRENVVVVVPEKPNTRPLVAVGTPDKPTEVLSQPGAPGDAMVAEVRKPEGGTAAAKSDSVKSDGAKSVAKSDAPKSETPKAAAKPDVVKPDSTKPPERVAALPQAASKPGMPEKKADLKIVSVDAQEGGRLDISGRAGPSSTVRLYLNDTLVATGRAAPDGRIAFTIGRGVSPGGYQIRIDQVEPGSGRVAHRAQVAFAFPDTAPLAPQASAKPVSVPPPIPERPKAETGSRPVETAARVAAAPPSAPALEERAAARQPDSFPKPPASAAKPSRPAEAAARPEEQRPPEVRPEPRPLARLAEAPSGLTTTWIQPQRQPAAETPSAAKPEEFRPSTESARRAAEALALTPAEPAQAAPRQAMAPLPATPAPDTRADASRPAQGLSVLPPGPATAEASQPGAVFVPEISTAKITRGDSLWVISKRTYGRGLRYTVIFDANQDQIKDPDLIYPGQIFVLPKDAPLGDQSAKRG